MAATEKHINKNTELQQETGEMIAGTYIDWGKSKEQIWAELEKKIEQKKPAGRRIVMNSRVIPAVAATLAILTGIAVFMQVYTRTIGVPAGKHSSVLLPDGSHIRLNAQSYISYKPMMWKLSRRVKFEGEAYFEVWHGKKFEVVSEKGKTSVIGTSFNIYSRSSDYQVTCVSGKVSVTAKETLKDIVLQPGQKATLNPGGALDIQSNVNTGQTTAWLNNVLSFTSMPLSKVFEEIGRQYGVIIRVPGNLDNTYTGAFVMSKTVENSLDLICKPFNLKFTRKSKNEFIISGNK